MLTDRNNKNNETVIKYVEMKSPYRTQRIFYEAK